MRNIREGGISIICLRCSLTGTRFFSSTAKTGVVLETDMIGSPCVRPSAFAYVSNGKEKVKTLRAFRIKNNAPMCSGRLVYLVSMNLYLFTRQPPTSRHSRSDSVIVIGVG